MQQLGPYLVLNEEGKPEYWCYFSIDSKSIVLYYTKKYGAAAIDWDEDKLQADSIFYIYDPKEKQPICYKYQNGKFYQIPLQAGNRVSVVREFKNGAFQLARLRAKDLEIKVESYIELQADLVLEKEPELPLLPAEDVVSSVVYATVDIDTARQSLLVKKLVKINSKEEGVLESGVLFVWEDSDDWYFKTFLFDEEIRGKLDSRLDGLIIAKAQDSRGDIELSKLEKQQFSRCYLKLTPAHQANITAIFSHVWPLSVDMSTDEQIAVCRAILSGKILSSNVINDETKLLEYNANIIAFRHYLRLSNINKIAFRVRPPLIYNIIFFMNRLLIAAARYLGDTSDILLVHPPEITKIPCGYLGYGNQNAMQSTHQGLLEEQEELLRLVVSVSSERLDALSINDLANLSANLEGIINPAEASPEINEVADYALLIICVENDSDQLVARDLLTENCRKLQDTIVERILEKLRLLSSIELTTAFAGLSSHSQLPDPLASLIQLFNQLEIFKDIVSFRAVVEHQKLSEVVEALKLFKIAGLLVGESAEANFNGIVRHGYPLCIAKIFIALQEGNILTEFNRSIVVKYHNPWAVAKALKIFKETHLLIDIRSLQENFNALVGHRNIFSVVDILEILQEAGLLIDENAQVIFNEVVRHYDLPRVLDALKILKESDLLIGNRAQEKFNAIIRHQSIIGVVDALQILKEANLLIAESAQTNFNMIISHQFPWKVAGALKLLQEDGLFLEENEQRNRNVVVIHNDPLGVVEIFQILKAVGLLTGNNLQRNFNAVIRHENLRGAVHALEILKEVHLLTGESAQENFNSVIRYQDILWVAHILQILKAAGLLTPERGQENFNMIVEHQDLLDLAEALQVVQLGGLLVNARGQENFDLIVSQQDLQNIVNVLNILQEEEFLSGESAQEIFSLVIGHKNALGVAIALQILKEEDLLSGVDVQANFNVAVKLLNYYNIILALSSLLSFCGSIALIIAFAILNAVTLDLAGLSTAIVGASSLSTGVSMGLFATNIAKEIVRTTINSEVDEEEREVEHISLSIR